MADHPIVGGVLFLMGLCLVFRAVLTLDSLPLLIMGNIFALNGALWLTLWCRKQGAARVTVDGARLLSNRKRFAAAETRSARSRA